MAKRLWVVLAGASMLAVVTAQTVSVASDRIAHIPFDTTSKDAGALQKIKAQANDSELDGRVAARSALRHPAREVRLYAARVLQEIGDFEQLVYMRMALQSEPDAEVRREIELAISRVELRTAGDNPRKQAVALEVARAKPDPAVAAWADAEAKRLQVDPRLADRERRRLADHQQLLGNLGGGTPPAAVADRTPANSSATTLGARGAPQADAKPAPAENTADRAALIARLADEGDDEDLPALLAVAKSDPDPMLRTAAYVAGLCVRLRSATDDAGRIGALAEAFKVDAADVRRWAAQQLAQLPAQPDRTRIAKAVLEFEQDAEVRTLLAGVLGR